MKKLSKKEGEELVNKAYLRNQFNSFRDEMFTEISRQTGVMVETLRHEMQMGFELMNMRFERVDRRFDAMDQRFNRLESKMSASELWLSKHEDKMSASEIWLANHEGRIGKLEA